MKGVGSTDLQLSGTVKHDKCMDVWYISASLEQPWIVEGISFTSLDVVCALD